VFVGPRPLVPVVRPRLIVALVRPRAIAATVRSGAIVAIVTPRRIVTLAATSRGVGALFKHRAALCAELWSISPQARDDPVHIGDLRAAEPPDVGRAGHLLYRGSLYSCENAAF